MRWGSAGRPRRAVPLATIVIGAFLIGGPAAHATPQEEAQGSQILRELESGKLKCGAVSASEFELVGEYAMGRRFASPAEHEAMDQMMARMMGAHGEEAAHEAMGRRFSGCGGGQLPASFGRMMGAVNTLGMMGGEPSDGRAYGGPESMMGGYAYGSSADTADEGFDGPSAGAMVGMMTVLIGAVALALLLLARRRPRPLDTLKRRYARGELTDEQYQERKHLLEGS